MSPEFLLTSLIVVATPGTGVIYTLAAGLARGARASVVAASGCTLGIVARMAAAIAALTALLHTSAVAFGAVKYLGVAYLLYLAWLTLKEKGALALEEANGASSARKTILTAVLINILNPKLTVFFFAFLPLFVRPDDPQRFARMLELSAVFMLITFVDLRNLRPGRGGGEGPGRQPSAGAGVDAPRLRRLLCRREREVRFDGFARAPGRAPEGESEDADLLIAGVKPFRCLKLGPAV